MPKDSKEQVRAEVKRAQAKFKRTSSQHGIGGRMVPGGLRRRAGEAASRLAARRGYVLIKEEDVLSAFVGDDFVSRREYDVVPRSYHTPIPHPEELPEGFWESPSSLSGGIDLNLERAIGTIETELAPHVAELDLPDDGPRPPGTFFLRNENYQSVDAELLYAMVRSRRPERVLELGSGFTTLLIAEAARRNAEEGAATRHTAYDPFPRPEVTGETPPPPCRLQPVSAVDVPLEEFRALGAGDILFVDTTHAVKVGSDVNRILLDVLPALAPGVIVHFHDIFLPWHYPRVWIEERQYFWAEQYMLQAFLAFNERFEVLIPAQAVAREHPERLAAVVPSFRGEGVGPAAFWLERR